MPDVAQIKEHAEVVGSDGQHVGTVDKVEGNQIKLTKNDQNAHGQHHVIPLDMVASVEGNTVRLNKSADEAKQQWHTQEEGGGNAAATGASGGGGAM
jgi:hypothetical protein